MKWFLVTLAALGLLIFLCVGLGDGKHGALRVSGSTSIQPFAELEAEAYEKSHPGEYIDVQGGGSTAGIQAAREGRADIGMCSRELTPEEQAEFQRHQIAWDGLAIVVPLSNPIENLTLDQVRRLFTGDLTNWKDVGGDDRPVRLITREEGSGTREAFQKLVMDKPTKTRISRKALTQESNGSVKELVKNDPAAIGYMSLGLVGTELKAVRINGVAATSAGVKAKDAANHYPLVRPFLFVTKGPPSPKAQAFIDFILSKEGQAFLEDPKQGLVGVRD
jgi:phosphate transport system substrate-binding protein